MSTGAYESKFCEPVLHTPKLSQVLQKLSVEDAPGVPHNPEHNSTCERFVRSLSDATRSNMHGVDHRIWDYGSQYAGDCWDRLPKQYPNLPEYNGMSPLEVLEQKTGRGSSKSDTSMLRRFGCLVYFRTQGQKVAKLEDKWRRGVHLGLCPKSSGWIVGTVKIPGRPPAKIITFSGAMRK